MENELVHFLTTRGWVCVPCGGSGGGTSMDRPDVITGSGYDDRIIGFEVKTAEKGNTFYIGKEDVKQIERFCDFFDCTPMFAFRRKGNKYWWFMTLDEIRSLHETEKSYRMKPEEEPDDPIELEDFDYRDEFEEDFGEAPGDMLK